ncbi:MAG: immunoglobulin domain-containing protein [Verrucomicrobiota bacterium]
MVAGTFNSTSFGMAGVAVSQTAAKSLYLMKMDGGGSGVWAKSAGSSMDPGNFITISSAVTFSPTANAIIWAGDFTGSLNLSSPPIASSGGKDVFVAKMSSSGTVLWVRTLSGSQDQFANAATVDDFGNIYVAGFFSGSMTVGSLTLSSLGLHDLFVAKFRDDGTPVWAKRIGWTDNDREVALCFTQVGELLVTGTVRGGASVDGTFLEGINGSDGFLAKFYSEGVLPQFVANPEGRVVSAGMTFTLTAELAVNDPSVRFQWWFNGAPLAGQTNRTLTVTNAQFTNAGSYYLVATNDAGAVKSIPALISYTDASTLLLSIHPSLTIFGTPGRTYRIEYSTEARAAAQWTLATNLTLASSPAVWIDPTAALGEKRFYRVLLLP